MLSSELELNFFVFNLVSFFFFCSLVEVFSEVLNDAVEVVAVLLPKLAKLFRTSFNYCQDGLPDLESFFDKSFDILLIGVFPQSEISLGFVEPNIGRVDVVILKECFLDISERNCLLFLDGQAINFSKLAYAYTSKFS